MDMKLSWLPSRSSDVDVAKDFYERGVGFVLDARPAPAPA